VEARKWKARHAMHYNANSLRSQEELFFAWQSEDLQHGNERRRSWKEENTRLLIQVQNEKKAIKAMIARSPSAKARKFVVDR
jgi:hypothetical protein